MCVFNYRYANSNDVSLILEFIKELAIYEKMQEKFKSFLKKV